MSVRPNHRRYRLPVRRLFWMAAVMLALSCVVGGRAEELRGPVLYLFAHQDDEIFILARMRADLHAGRSVHAVWITDGRRDGHPEQREKESRAVMSRVGVPEENLHFLGFPDHASLQHLPEIYARVREVASDVACVEIVSPAYEGGNIDHDVAAFIAAMITRDAGPAVTHVEYPLYNHWNGRQHINQFLPDASLPVAYVSLDGEAGRLVRDALRLYSSQRILLMLLEMTGHKKVLFERGEPYRKAADYDFLARPADEPCGYEVAGLHRAKVADWTEAVASFLNAKAGRG